MYLNKINLGNRSYGIATAAQNYYGKELKDLTLQKLRCLQVYQKHRITMIRRKQKILKEQQKEEMLY
ncbi:transglycosylase domain-containing protein [Bacillus pacificus]